MKITIYAKQVPPGWQVSPFWENPEMYENIVIAGNEQMREFGTDEYWALVKELPGLYRWYHALGGEFIEDYPGQTFRDVLFSVLPIKRELDENEWERLIDLAKRFDKRSAEHLCEGLSLLIGEPYESRFIYGCSQSEWQQLFYPACYGDDFPDMIQAEYFNTGTEWIISSSDNSIVTPKDARETGHTVYCHSWSDEGIKREIAKHASYEGYGNAEDINVVLFKFDGYSHVPVYKRS